MIGLIATFRAGDDAKDAEGDGRAEIVERTAVDTQPTTPEEAALQMEVLGPDSFCSPAVRQPGPSGLSMQRRTSLAD
jgi:hypothetical protein